MTYFWQIFNTILNKIVQQIKNIFKNIFLKIFFKNISRIFPNSHLKRCKCLLLAYLHPYIWSYALNTNGEMNNVHINDE
jgi:hypothetical protein